MINKTIVFIGGSHGMGLGTARVITQRGAQIVLVGRDKSKLEAARQELSGQVRIVQGPGGT